MLWSAIASGFVTGLIPIGLAEAAALALGAVLPPEKALLLLGAFTLAHVAGKIGWYWLGTAAGRVPPRFVRTRVFIERSRKLLADHPVYGAGVLAAAAFASVPPFHIASIAAGIARIPFLNFLLICIVGRALRFGLIASAPTIFRAVF
jgi:membrane protein YqaA with SNARE-associated domain